mgnify:CR=1 FL=1
MTRKSNNYYAGDDIESPIRPPKPGVFDRNDPQSIRDYADRMEAWQIADAAYKVGLNAYRAQRQWRLAILRQDLAEENDMNIAQSTVLFDFACGDAAMDFAWEDGHSEAFSAVIDRFEQLVEIVENFNRAEN